MGDPKLPRGAVKLAAEALRERPLQDWGEIPEGHEVVAVADPDWVILASDDGRQCRRKLGKHAHCSRPAVAALRRLRSPGAREAWWAYCDDHMYGHWIEGGRVMFWVLRKKTDADA